MVFGVDPVENVRRLEDIVDDVTLVLFHTPTQHNIPTSVQVRTLRQVAEERKMTVTVHLPASLEPASQDPGLRRTASRLSSEICKRTEDLRPRYYILHIPISKPTLVPVPGCYYTAGFTPDWDWSGYGLDFLENLNESIGDSSRLLVENINYSPVLLEPFLNSGLCELCLDLGHLLLGGENVAHHLERYKNETRVIHLHGVDGHEEHLSLKRMEKNRPLKWIHQLCDKPYEGILTLEVFSPQDLKESIDVVLEGCGRAE